MNLLIMGPAGSGKGTMSKKIVEYYNIPHISTGDMLRKSIEDKLQYGLEAKKLMDEGKLVPDELINKIVRERFQSDDVKNGFLADGYPRTLPQALSFDTILKDLGKHVDCVINLTIDFQELSKRITGRRLCPNCGKIYNVHFDPSKDGDKCEVCQTVLYQRGDDTVEQLTVRLEEHQKNTEPVLDHYRKMGIVKDVNASQDIEKVFADIKIILEACK